eukprot:GILK01017461.1.p1 GENE.GILK01017461.1~~GILK01017461.1.p1  ORF type:complete len:314 (+),score=45.14 GILK01017461.1:51-944(+)
MASARPPRRASPQPTAPNTCQFCGETDDLFADYDELLDHFMNECVFLCPCPICLLPVEIREVHWHMAEDCPMKDKVKQCPKCFEALSAVGTAFDEHINANTCERYDPMKIKCPLCSDSVQRSDVAWEDHITLPPYCPGNPRSVHGNVDDMGDEEEDEKHKKFVPNMNSSFGKDSLSHSSNKGASPSSTNTSDDKSPIPVVGATTSPIVLSHPEGIEDEEYEEWEEEDEEFEEEEEEEFEEEEEEGVENKEAMRRRTAVHERGSTAPPTPRSVALKAPLAAVPKKSPANSSLKPPSKK